MAYRFNPDNLSCADRVRYAQAAREMGLDGSDLVMALVHSFFESRGVKNPSKTLRFPKKIRHAQKV